MSARVGFTASDAERQAADSAANYMNRALRMIAERLALEKSMERDPAAFAVQFAPLVAALIEAQAREFQSWVFLDRLQSLDESLLSGLADLAEHWEEMNAGTCRSCARKARPDYDRLRLDKWREEDAAERLEGAAK
jgi:hypothetical protein